LRTVGQSAQDRLKPEREAQASSLAAAIAAAVQAAMELWMHADSPAAQDVLDRTTAKTVEAADSAGSPVPAALLAKRLAYRVSEIQEALGIGRNLDYDLINSGQLGHIKAGKAVLVPASALERFLASEQATSLAAGS
jgi:excisionase family DNA binding protein